MERIERERDLWQRWTNAIEIVSYFKRFSIFDPHWMIAVVAAVALVYKPVLLPCQKKPII